jgi:hypothetical protein
MRDVVADRDRLVHDIGQKNAPAQLALDKLLGISHRTELVTGRGGLQRAVQAEAGELPPGPAFDNLQEVYRHFRPDDPDVQHLRRVTQSTTFDFPQALTNSMNNLLVRAYSEADYHLGDIVSSTTQASNFKELRRSRLKFVEDLEEVDEDMPYQEVGTHGDEGYTFNVTTRGGFLSLTRRAILADRVDLIRRALDQLGRSAARTLAKVCWDQVISNLPYGVDGLAWFHLDHKNLGAAALGPTIAEAVGVLDAARAAIFSQVEAGSEQRLGLSGPFMLAVPIELEAIAREVNLGLFIDAVSTPNPWFHRFGADCERIFTNPFFVNPADWALFDISKKVPILEVAYLFGKQMPELVLSDEPVRSASFRQDRLVWKMRHEYAVAIEDFRGGYKSVVV